MTYARIHMNRESEESQIWLNGEKKVMIKVFLVEDEVIVREGIKNNIDWEQNGYKFCGEASDGELAFPMICKEKPDIVITDIRMPFMDGLELSRLIKKELSGVKIIILSGHEEFEYAKEAIQIGIEEYLLKPISGEELLQVVNHVAEKIRSERASVSSSSNDVNDTVEQYISAKREFFNEIINGDISLSDTLARGRELRIELMAENYNILLLKVQRPQNEEGFSMRIVNLYQRVEKYAEENPDVTCFDRAPEGKVILFKGVDKTDVEKKIKEFIRYFEKTVVEYEDVLYFGSVGISVSRLRELNKSYEAASHAFSYRFLTDENRFVSFEEIESKNKKSSEPADCLVGDVDTQGLDKKKIESFLSGGEKEEIPFFVKEYIKNTGEAGANSMIFRQYIVMDMFFAASRFVSRIDEEKAKDFKEPFAGAKQMQETIGRLDTTISYVEKLFEAVMEIRDHQMTQHNSDVVEEARLYIEANYSDEQLTLNRVASHVNVSPNHLSAMFSQRTGQTFIKYLTDIRMGHARELLKCTNKRSNEISEEVGYKDPHYFSHLFKKNIGCTPLQYRERSNAE